MLQVFWSKNSATCNAFAKTLIEVQNPGFHTADRSLHDEQLLYVCAILIRVHIMPSGGGLGDTYTYYRAAEWSRGKRINLLWQGGLEDVHDGRLITR